MHTQPSWLHMSGGLSQQHGGWIPCLYFYFVLYCKKKKQLITQHIYLTSTHYIYILHVQYLKYREARETCAIY